MNKFYLLMILFFCVIKCKAQELTEQRIAYIKNCTVKIEIEGTTISGTGFFVGQNGTILTCWHVVSDAILRDSVNKITGFKNIFATTYWHQKIKMEFPEAMLKDGGLNATAYDYCALVPSKDTLNVPYLTFGNYDSLREGDKVYTCGYPLGFPVSFVSSGSVSTKYVDATSSVSVDNKNYFIAKNVALLDITLNAGNSGGAIIKMGKSIGDDRVIGLADFLITPIGENDTKNILSLLKKAKGKYKIDENVDLTDLLSYFFQILSEVPFGLSGCISTNHFLNGIGNKPN